VSAPHYLGLTWDHPRGYNALAAAAAALDPVRDGLSIAWSRQPLEGFESHPIDDLAARFDIVVIDHPHVGEAVAKDCFFALEDLFAAAEIAGWSTATIGPCLSSYRYAGRHWALPLDAATQVMACRPERLDEALPRTWDEVVTVAGRRPVALSLAGPHAILSFMSLCVALGEPPASRDPGRFVSAETGTAALEIMAALAATTPDWTKPLNPIGLLEAMAQDADLALVPLVYGYVNYAAPADPARLAVRFADAPVVAGVGRPGSTLGGTGIAVSRRAEVTPALLDHMRWLMSSETQTAFIPAHDGQPSRRDAWADAAVNARWGGFYRDTAATLEAAWVRPRFHGYIPFQTRASAILREALSARTPAAATLATLQDAYAAARPDGAEI
jgi:multiple sugar transport system substrate-binding protein